jgi:hypothetical protein
MLEAYSMFAVRDQWLVDGPHILRYAVRMDNSKLHCIDQAKARGYSGARSLKVEHSGVLL